MTEPGLPQTPLETPQMPPDSALLGVWLAVTQIIAPFGPAILRKRLARGKEDPARWTEKLGQISTARPEGRVIWLHAVSVGEGLSVLTLLKALTAQTGVTVLLTCTTVTAMGLMQARVPERVIVQFLPLDLPGVGGGWAVWHGRFWGGSRCWLPPMRRWASGWSYSGPRARACRSRAA